MHGDDIDRRIERHRAAERRRESMRARATGRSAAELQKLAQELQAIQRSRPEARSLPEPLFVPGTAPLSVHSDDVSGDDSDWRAGSGHNPPYLTNVVGHYTFSYNPVSGAWLTHRDRDPITREEAIDLFKDALAKWVALEYPKEIQKETDQRAVEEAERERQRLFEERRKSQQLKELLTSSVTCCVVFFLWMEFRLTDVLSLSLFEGLFVLVAGYGLGLAAIVFGLFSIKAAFVYFFE